MLDLLSDILTRLSLRGTLYFRTSFTPPFGIQVPPFENVARFHFVQRGELKVHVPATGETLRLKQGDLILIPHGAAHMLLCNEVQPMEALPLDRVLEEAGYKGDGVLVYGGADDGRDTQLICGHFSFSGPPGRGGTGHMLIDRLPPFIVIENYGEEGGAWIEATLRMIGSEVNGARIGADLIALKLSEVLFAQAIRAYLEHQSPSDAALAGFADQRISRALTAFHRAPAEDWSVEGLAREAGMSRTAFAQVFAEKMAVTPMQYLTNWRMQIACHGLSESRWNVADAAAEVGYASEAAFSRVFKKQVGLSPAAYKAMH
ncbi:AraC family transcriptional regulator [Ruegeria sp. HKCCD8929]|uniref:AraC family transcriptional regulator n=1 Tax=Ruegeria sp. HKCCD8929 TaxID=2683006 RepID=UPI00148783B8|nr:AraC family transcriptional regulator [Ruegeria sp. HKCCD8929]